MSKLKIVFAVLAVAVVLTAPAYAGQWVARDAGDVEGGALSALTT